MYRFAVGLFLAAIQLGANAPTVTPPFGHTAVPLEGPWLFHPGDDLKWADPNWSDSSWSPILTDQPWEAQGHHGLVGFAWYRKQIDASSTPEDIPLGIYFPSVDSACEVYWNGLLVGRFGKVPPKPVWFGGVVPFTVALGKVHRGVLAVRVWKAPIAFSNQEAEGGLIGVPRIGALDTVTLQESNFWHTWLRSGLFALFVAGICAVAGFLSLFLWLRHRDRKLLIWLAIAMFYPLEIFVLTAFPGALSFRVFYGSIAPVIALNLMALWFLLIELLGLSNMEKLVRWTRIVIALEVMFDVCDGALQLFDWSTLSPDLFLCLDVALTLVPITLEFWGFVIVIAAFRKGLDRAQSTLAIAALLADLLQAFEDFGDLGRRWTHWTYREAMSKPLFTISGVEFPLRPLIGAFLLGAILAIAWRYFRQQTARRNQLEQEFQSAQAVQRVLIPESLPTLPGYHVASAYRPASEVGGDFFQLIPLADSYTLIVVGDVSGKGLQAAMTVALLVGVIRSVVELSSEPAQVLAAMNRRLHGRMQHGFATCLVLRLHADGAAIAANAGHPAPILGGVELDLPPALPLGLDLDAEYEQLGFWIPPNSQLLLYTDGLLEARDATGTLFGFDKTLDVSRKTATEIADIAQAFGQDDDITVLTVSRQMI